MRLYSAPAFSLAARAVSNMGRCILEAMVRAPSFFVGFRRFGWAQDLAIGPTSSSRFTQRCPWLLFLTGTYLRRFGPDYRRYRHNNTPILSLFHTLSFFGRSANFTDSWPMEWEFEGWWRAPRPRIPLRMLGLPRFASL